LLQDGFDPFNPPPIILRGNLDRVSPKKLNAVKPKDLSTGHGKQFLLYNVATGEKTRAVFLGAEILDVDDEDEEYDEDDDITHFTYKFKDDMSGDIHIDGLNTQKHKRNENPFAKNIVFEHGFQVFKPLEKHFVAKKTLKTLEKSKKIPEDVSRSISKYFGGNFTQKNNK